VVQAVIFDMDGVLIDSEPYWAEAEQQVFRQLGVTLDPAITSQTSGMTTRAVTELWFNHSPWQGLSIEQAEQAVIDYVASAVQERGVAKKGVVELLQQLQNWQIPVALATNSPASLMHAVMDKLQIRPFFQAFCSIEQVRQGKPNPEIYLLAASKLGVAAEHCLVFEDSVTGLTAAKAAGMKVVALPAPHHWHKTEYGQAESRLQCFSDIRPQHFQAWGFKHR
jgi:HAD superfamily hydrolase (TIGR01509 family)